jgi:peptidoglycan/xylan/chitin deacetylase (PgdA/CDA1 family)
MRAGADEDALAVLAFHSISSEPGPTSISATTFRMQMDVLAESGFVSMTCQDFLDWHQGRAKGAARRVLITFDDGFADFATAAFPILRERSFSCMVFVPTGKLGQREDWPGANASARPLMSWSTLSELARAGVEFGGHGVTHADLTRLAPGERRQEIERSAQDLAERTGRRSRGFAPPYGHVNAAVLADLARTYDVAFGTRFDHARPARDLFDVPRIEMHYFREARHWRAFVRGDRSYFLARRALRAVKTAGTRLLNV